MIGEFDTDVLVIGAGPVGLTVAMDLASRGVQVSIVELRHRGEPPNVKCNHVSARSMEIFRRLGVAKGAAQQPGCRLIIRTTSRIGPRRPGSNCRASTFPAVPRATPTSPDRTAGGRPRSPPHRINQLYLEPVLFNHTEALPGVRILNCTAVTGFVQDDCSITATVRDLETDESREIKARYLIGCDGGKSETRRAIGAKLSGEAVVQRVQSTFIRAPSLLGLMQAKPGLGDILDQSAPQRQHVCDRWPRDLADP